MELFLGAEAAGFFRRGVAGDTRLAEWHLWWGCTPDEGEADEVGDSEEAGHIGRLAGGSSAVNGGPSHGVVGGPESAANVRPSAYSGMQIAGTSRDGGIARAVAGFLVH